jgi:ABC-type uncharacterized transport system permease subunit
MRAKSAPARSTENRDLKRASNLRTAAILGSIALVFFGGIVAAQFAGGTTVGMGVLGFAIIGFLAVAIGRNVSK